MKTIKLTIFSILGATLLGLGLYSCSNDDTTGVNELEKTNVSKNANRKVTDNDAIKDFTLAIKMKYNAEVIMIDELNTLIKYEDNKELYIIKESEDSFLMKGSKINDKTFSVTLSKNQTIPYEFTEIKDGNTVTFNPCSEHPKGEKFNDCFKREFSDFCDGLVGCLSLAVFPWHISAVIAAHCLAC